MNLTDTHTQSAEIHWKRQRDAYQGDSQDADNPGQAEVEETIHTVGDKPEWILECSVWNGLFGGCPSEDAGVGAYDFDAARSNGQVQEITATIYAKGPKGPRRRLFERDLHQLTPSASFPGTERHEFVWPKKLDPGTRIYVVVRTSQRDRGAHTRATVTLSKVDPYPFVGGAAS